MPAQDEDYKRLLGMISESGLQINFSNMYKENHRRIDDLTTHYFEIIARCNGKRRVLKMTTVDNSNHIYVKPEYSFDSQSKTLYITNARPECKIYDLFNIFTEDDSRKWKCKTVRQLAEERRRKQKRFWTIMLASHPRACNVTQLWRLDRDVLKRIALLSLS